jgi:hypothetical protein
VLLLLARGVRADDPDLPVLVLDARVDEARVAAVPTGRGDDSDDQE